MTDHDLQVALHDLVCRCAEEGPQSDAAAVLSLLGLTLYEGRSGDLVRHLTGFSCRAARRAAARRLARQGAGNN